MKSELTPSSQRPSLEEYEALYIQAEEMLAKPDIQFEDVHKLSNQLKIAVRKIGLNPQKSDEQLHLMYEMYKRVYQMVHRLKSPRSSIKRQPMLIITNNVVDLYYLANSPFKRKADRVILPLSEAELAQVARFEEKYQERKRQQTQSAKPKRERTPLYSKHDLN